jgi:hypothetical protein
MVAPSDPSQSQAITELIESAEGVDGHIYVIFMQVGRELPAR